MINTIAFPGLGIEAFNIVKYFEVFGFRIHWYGVIIAAGILLGFLYTAKEGKKRSIDQDTLLDIVLYGLPSAIISARIYYVIFEFDQYKNNLLDVFKIWEGGIAIYGAVIGACISTLVYCKVKNISFTKIFDTCSFGLLIGQIIGRWGNFINVEAYGRETNLPWRMLIVDQSIAVHPTFLYESLWNIGVFLFLRNYSKKQKFEGELFLIYLVGYGLGRLWIEGLRTDSLFLGPFRISQIVAFLCVAIGLYFVVKNRKKQSNITL